MVSRRLLRIKAVKAIYSHFLSDGDSLVASQRNLLYSINKTHELYMLMFSLIVDVANYAETVQKQRQAKLRPSNEEKNPNRRFVENRVVAQLKSSKVLCAYLEKNDLSWSAAPELIKKLATKLFASEFYTTYMDATQSGYLQDKELVIAFYSNLIEDFDLLYDVVEEMSVFWPDDIEYVTSSLIKTIRQFKATMCTEHSSEDLPFMPVYRDSDDARFVKELFTQSIVYFSEAVQYIERNAKNWDLDRIAFMDKVLMCMAMVEMTKFDQIPLRVSMDEYIEIAKYYSTNNSGQFINGLLDKILQELTAEGKISKTGKGLE